MYGLELALDARIWKSEGEKRKTFWAENGRTIGSLGPFIGSLGFTHGICP